MILVSHQSRRSPRPRSLWSLAMTFSFLRNLTGIDLPVHDRIRGSHGRHAEERNYLVNATRDYFVSEKYHSLANASRSDSS